MSLEAQLNEVLYLVLSNQHQASITSQELIRTIDLTLLDEHVSLKSLSQLNHDATVNEVAAVCVYSNHLSEFQHLNLATVVNFPEGNEELTTSLATIINAVQLGAHEIDYVFPYQMYLTGKKTAALNQCQAVIELCKKNNLVSKIIIETGAFPELQNIYEVSTCLIELGCDFLKTSTGKITRGASLATVFSILSAINDSRTSCGLKVSGGVKTPLQAYQYANLAQMVLNKKINKTWFRIGASSLLNELLKN